MCSTAYETILGEGNVAYYTADQILDTFVFSTIVNSFHGVGDNVVIVIIKISYVI